MEEEKIDRILKLVDMLEVTDENNNIVKHNSKNMWGARIFEEAHTAETRRNFRSARRRADRRKERINILQSLLKDDMDKE